MFGFHIEKATSIFNIFVIQRRMELRNFKWTNDSSKEWGQMVDIQVCTQLSNQVPLTTTLIGHSLLPSSPSWCWQIINAVFSSFSLCILLLWLLRYSFLHLPFDFINSKYLLRTYLVPNTIQGTGDRIVSK